MKLPGVVAGFLICAISGIGTGLAAVHLSGAQAPDFVLKSLSGENVRLSEYRGDVVLLSFWATWCGDCRAQLVGFNEIYDRYREAGFELLAVNMDRDWENARKAVDALQVSYPVLYDTGREISRLYDIASMPVTILIDREGVVRDVTHGYKRGTEEEYLDRVRALLRE
jgi:peroxiredoxin